MNIVYLRRSDSTVDRIIRAAFPGLTIQKVHADITDKIAFTGTQWDEGHRNTYRIVRLSDMAVMPIGTAPFMQRSPLHENYHIIESGFVVVCHHEGRYEHISITARPDDINPMLPAPTDLSRNEKIVLTATARLKNSYGGRTNIRYTEAHSYTKISHDDWNAAQQLLISKGFLKKNLSITPEGRNAIGNVQLYELRD